MHTRSIRYRQHEAACGRIIHGLTFLPLEWKQSQFIMHWMRNCTSIQQWSINHDASVTADEVRDCLFRFDYDYFIPKIISEPSVITMIVQQKLNGFLRAESKCVWSSHFPWYCFHFLRITLPLLSCCSGFNRPHSSMCNNHDNNDNWKIIYFSSNVFLICSF